MTAHHSHQIITLKIKKIKKKLDQDAEMLLRRPELKRQPS